MKILPKLSLFVILLSSLFVSCTSGRKNVDPDMNDTIPWFCYLDTNTVLSLANKYMTTVKNQQFDSLFQYVYSINNGKLRTLSESSRKKITAHYTAFPVLDYTIRDYQFNSPEDIKVICNYIFTHDTNNGFPNSMNVTLKMQRFRGHWCITLMGHE